ncbi:MAG: hypothetical protein NVS9B7_07040 [Flavisolibacter sp.]
MKHNKDKFCFLLLAFCFFQSTWSQKTGNALVQKLVIIRHGEKPEKGDNLSCQGFNRSVQLPAVLFKKIGVPQAIFVPALNEGSKTSAARMYQTIIPYAIKYNLRINTRYEVKDVDGLVKGIGKESGTVLVVWEHKAIGKIMKALGIPDAKWDESDFDTMYVVTFPNGKAKLTKDAENIKPSGNCQ